MRLLALLFLVSCQDQPPIVEVLFPFEVEKIFWSRQAPSHFEVHYKISGLSDDILGTLPEQGRRSLSFSEMKNSLITLARDESSQGHILITIKISYQDLFCSPPDSGIRRSQVPFDQLDGHPEQILSYYNPEFGFLNVYFPYKHRFSSRDYPILNFPIEHFLGTVYDETGFSLLISRDDLSGYNEELYRQEGHCDH